DWHCCNTLILDTCSFEPISRRDRRGLRLEGSARSGLHVRSLPITWRPRKIPFSAELLHAWIIADEGKFWKDRKIVHHVVMHCSQLLKNLKDTIFVPKPGIDPGLMSDGGWVRLRGDLFGLAAAATACIHVAKKAAGIWAQLFNDGKCFLAPALEPHSA